MPRDGVTVHHGNDVKDSRSISGQPAPGALGPSGFHLLVVGGDVFQRLAESDRLLTAKELAALLAVSPKTLYSYVARNLIPYYKIETNVRFRGKDIADWLRRRAG